MDGRFLDIGGTRVFFVEKGRGLPVVYVHGNTGSHQWFDRVMDIAGARTIALDMPNFGRSGPLAGPVTMDNYADAVAAFIRALDLEPVILVAHSLGGAAAISLAVRNPQAVCGLVLVDSAAPSGLVTPRDRHPLIEMMRTRRDILSQALRAVVPTLKDEAFFEALVGDASKMAPAAWVGNAEALSSFDYRDRGAAFTGPVLVVWGRKDIIVTEAMARETAAAFPGARLEILEDVGHSVMAEDPACFTGLIAEFVRGSVQGRRSSS
jgi:branched-chain amino acid transport system permease protein